MIFTISATQIHLILAACLIFFLPITERLITWKTTATKRHREKDIKRQRVKERKRQRDKETKRQMALSFSINFRTINHFEDDSDKET